MGIVGKVRETLTAQYQYGVVFTHAQKCGGSSLEKALFQHYRFSRERIFPIEARNAMRVAGTPLPEQIPETESLAFRQQLVAYALQRGVKCISGHNPLSPEIRNIDVPNLKFITLLRDPVERFCSHLRYAYNTGMETSAGNDIDEILESPRAKWWGGLYATHFGGWLDITQPITQTMIDEARTLILSLDVIGYLDNVAAFEKDVGDLLNIKVRMGHENRTTDRASSWQGTLNDMQMDKIRRLCQPNIDIYEYVREKSGPHQQG